MEENKIDRQELEKIDIFRLLQEFWMAFRRLFWLPVVLAVLCAALLGVRYWRSYTPMYASEVTFTIQLTDAAMSDLSGSSNFYDKATAEQLSKTFPYLIQSELMQTMLRREMGVDYLNGAISARTVSNTNLFTIRVTSPDPQAAYDILSTVITVYPRAADYVIGATRMNLLTEPAVADAPYNAFDPVSTVVRGGALGAFAGLLAVLAYAATRRSVREAEDIRRRLNRTCLAALPQVTQKKRSGERALNIRNEKISAAFQESIRSLRIKFLREAEKHRAQVVMVTSTLPGEGKTTVASNLALTLSRNGAKVILVDLDLRKPSVKKAVGVDETSLGVPELLSRSDVETAASLVEVEGSTLRLLAGDRPAENARQQISSRRFAAIVRELRQEADYIILDTPPCGLVADTAALARMADGIIYVLRSGKAQLSHVMDCLQLLGESGTPILGCVLNGAANTRSGYGYGYGGYYGKYNKHGRGKRTQEEN